MELIRTEQFFQWLRTTEVAPDGRYDPPSCLVYVPYRPYHRFWEVPAQGTEVPFFVSHLLAGLDPWRECYVWPRDGRWPAPDKDDHFSEQVRGVILSGAGIPAGFEGAVKFGRD